MLALPTFRFLCLSDDALFLPGPPRSAMDQDGHQKLPSTSSTLLQLAPGGGEPACSRPAPFRASLSCLRYRVPDPAARARARLGISASRRRKNKIKESDRAHLRMRGRARHADMISCAYYARPQVTARLPTLFSLLCTSMPATLGNMAITSDTRLGGQAQKPQIHQEPCPAGRLGSEGTVGNNRREVQRLWSLPMGALSFVQQLAYPSAFAMSAD